MYKTLCEFLEVVVSMSYNIKKKEKGEGIVSGIETFLNDYRKLCSKSS